LCYTWQKERKDGGYEGRRAKREEGEEEEKEIKMMEGKE
jgi:hypothetical protein